MQQKNSTKTPKRSLNPLISIIKGSPQYLKSNLGIYAICMHLGCILCVIGTGATLIAGVPHGWCFFLAAGFIIIIVSLFMAHRRDMTKPEPRDPLPGSKSHDISSTAINRTMARKKPVRKGNNSGLNRRTVDILEIKLQPAVDRYWYYEQRYDLDKRRIRMIQSRLLYNCIFGARAITYILKLVYFLYIQRGNPYYSKAINMRFKSTISTFLGEVSSLYTVHKRINRKEYTLDPGQRARKTPVVITNNSCGTVLEDQQCSQQANVSCTEQLSIKTDKIKSYIGNKLLYPDTLLICQFYLN